jgi:hypothetical protein
LSPESEPLLQEKGPAELSSQDGGARGPGDKRDLGRGGEPRVGARSQG